MTEAHVYKAICQVSAALAKQGVGKTRRNQQQGYMYRGIDDIYAAVTPLAAEASLCIIPKFHSREMSIATSKAGAPLYHHIVHGKFLFVSALDGSFAEVESIGEAMDSGDKGLGKAQSYAIRNALISTFQIPTEGDNDTDAVTHEAPPVQPPAPLPRAADTPLARAAKVASQPSADDWRNRVDRAIQAFSLVTSLKDFDRAEIKVLALLNELEQFPTEKAMLVDHIEAVRNRLTEIPNMS